MKMIRAVIRPEKADVIAQALAKSGFPALTKWDVVGRGKQKGIRVGSQTYDELAKTMLLVVVKDEEMDRVVQVIRDSALTGQPGDGKIFITPVENVYTVRTGRAEP